MKSTSDGQPGPDDARTAGAAGVPPLAARSVATMPAARTLAGPLALTTAVAVEIARPPVAAVVPAPPAPPAPAPDVSVITADFEISGSVSTPRDLRIAGRIAGDVTCRNALVETGGVIDGRLLAETAAIEGWVKGGIVAEHVHLRSGCVVDGDITTATLQVDDGAQFEGRVLRPATQP